MRDARGRELQRSRRGLECYGVPVVHQYVGIDGAEPARQVITRTRRINRRGIVPICVLSAVDGARRAVTAIAAQGDVMKRGWLLLRQRIEREVGLTLTSVLLVHQRHDSSHRRGRSRGASDSGNFHLAARAWRAFSRESADGISTQIRAIGGKE